MIIMYIAMLAFGVWIAWLFFKTAGIWLVAMSLMFVVTMITCDLYCFGASIICGIMFVVALCCSNKESYSNAIDSIDKSNKREKQIEEEYGIIDFTDK